MVMANHLEHQCPPTFTTPFPPSPKALSRRRRQQQQQQQQQHLLLLCYAAVLILLETGVAFTGCFPLVIAAEETTTGFGNEKDGGAGRVFCRIDLGGADAVIALIPSERINDGYCDCPGSGKDEPATSACAGFEHWAGVSSVIQSDDTDSDTHAEASTSTATSTSTTNINLFQCPLELNKQLSVSKVADGICDCCCGSDEPVGHCEDVCDQLFSEARAARAQMQTIYRQGHVLRIRALDQFATHCAHVQKQVDVQQQHLSNLQSTIIQTQAAVQTLKNEAYALRRKTVIDRTRFIAGDETMIMPTLSLFEPLIVPELVEFIEYACQLTGEMVSTTHRAYSENNDRLRNPSTLTCLPLRLAGIDAGIIWEHGTFEVTRPCHKDLADSCPAEPLLSELFHVNVQQANESSPMLIYNEHGLMNHEQSPNHNLHVSQHKSSQQLRRSGLPRPRYNGHDDDNDDVESSLYNSEEYSDDDEYLSHQQRHENRGNPPIEYIGSTSSSNEPEDADSDEQKTQHWNEEIERLLNEFQRRPFSSSRQSFLEQSGRLIARINEILKRIKEAEEIDRNREHKLMKERQNTETNEDQFDDGANDEIETSTVDIDIVIDGPLNDSLGENLPEAHDPLSLPLVRGKLDDLQSRIRNGFQYAVSANILLRQLVNAHTYDESGEQESSIHSVLSQLAVATLAHGRLSALHVWQIYLEVTPELTTMRPYATATTDLEQDTCQSTWKFLCPPQTVQRSRNATNPSRRIPPDVILQVAEAFCAQQQQQQQRAAVALTSSQSCLSTTSTHITTEDYVPLPTSIPDGYLGYYAIDPRLPEDPLSEYLDPMRLQVVGNGNRKALTEAMAQEKRLIADQEQLQQTLINLSDSMGGDDPSKFGPNGELFAIKDECLSHDTGKYVYEVCLFGKAKQNESKGASSGSSTDLGHWKDATIDDASGQRVWRWENGQRCWNGPHRSATAYIRCGAKTQIVSVEEPEMCKYELQVESYLACDERFRSAEGLELI